MKIAITAKEGTLASDLDPHFGRAKTLIVFETDTNQFTAHDNAQNLNAAQGAGIQAAQMVSRLGAKALITGNVGPKAFRTLKEAGIKIYLSSAGTVTEAIEAFNKNELKEPSGATKEGHWA
ncbi:MAG: NifB/NifX family molybdenum-iron cluster-binding protein [Lentisphaerota bacterium]